MPEGQIDPLPGLVSPGFRHGQSQGLKNINFLKAFCLSKIFHGPGLSGGISSSESTRQVRLRRSSSVAMTGLITVFFLQYPVYFCPKRNSANNT